MPHRSFSGSARRRLVEPARRDVLIAPRPQTLWGLPAVANFTLGGLGAGLYLAAVAASAFGHAAALALASWLGPALVLAGFAAVATEAGRPWRGARVVTRAGTSWMSREVWIGGAFALCALGDLAAPALAWRAAATAAALALALAQGLILRAARGVTAWDVAVMPLLFVSSALASGAGLLAVLAVARGAAPAGAALGGLAALAIFGWLVWLTYVTWSAEAEFIRTTAMLRAGALAVVLAGGGYLAPFALSALGLALPALARATALGAGALLVAGQIAMKWTLITRAGQLRPITLVLPGRPR